jgi:large repetitive protein
MNMKANFMIIKKILLLILINCFIGGRLFANDGKQPPPTPTVVVTPPSGVNSLNCYATVTASGCGVNAVHWYSGSTFLSSVNPYEVKYDTGIDIKAACFDGTTLGSFSPEYKALSYMAANLLPSGNICSTETSLLLNASTSSSGFTTYYWYRNGMPISGSGSNIPSYNVTSSGTYTLLTGKGHCYGTTAPAIITFSTTPIISTSFSGVCGSQTVTMSTQPLPTGTFQWKLNNVPISGATSSSYSTTVEGTYQVDYTYLGCTVTSFPYIFIQSTPPVITLEPPRGVGCDAFLDATGCSNEVRWYKDVSGVWTFVTTGNTYTFPVTTVPSNYRATCKKGSCETAPSNVVTAYPYNYVSISPNGGAYCANSFITLQANTFNTGTGLSFQWKKNGTNVFFATSQTYNASSSGQYTVLVSDGTCSYLSQAVTVSSVGNVVPTISAGAVTGACGSQSVTLTVTNIASGTYQWKLNGVAMPGVFGTSYTATSSGAYSVELTQGACTAVSTQYKFNTPPLIFLQDAVSPSCNNTLSAINTAGTLRWYKNIAGTWTLDNTGANPFTFIPNNIPPDYRATNEMNGCETPPSNVVTATPYLYAALTPNPSFNICSGGSTLLTATSPYTGINYQWERNVTNISGANSATYAATLAGNYQVVITKGACTFRSIVSTGSITTPPTVSISSTVPSPANIINGQTLSLTANGCSGGTISWSNGETTTNIAASPPVGSTTYTFTCTRLGCVVTSAGFIINVNPLLPPSISASSLYICASINDTLTATGCPSGGIYTWNTTPIQTGSAIIVNPSITTGYRANCTLGAVVSGNSPTVIITVNATITSIQSGNWNNKTTWSCNCIPDVCNNVIIETIHNVTIPQTTPLSYIGKLKNLTLKGTINNLNTATLKLN